MKKIRINLLGRIGLALVFGVISGLFFTDWAVRIFVTFNALFSQFLGFVIPLIILGLVSAAVGQMGRNAKNLLLITVVLAYGFTLFSGLLSYSTGAAIFPSLIDAGSAKALALGATPLTPYFTIEMPPLMSVMTALLLAFVLGLGMANIRSRALMEVAMDFEEIISKLITATIIPLLPIYIFSIFLNMTYEGKVFAIMLIFIKIIGVIFVLHILLLVLQYVIAGVVVKKNPFKLLWTMLPAYATALGTQSSAATIPVTLKQSRINGVSEEVSGFAIPLCATIHLSGSTLKIVACALALMMMQGIPHSFTLFLGFILMLGITMIAAPGVPGGAIMASLGILQSILGFGETDLALMIALYITMDSFGTACNVTGDGAIALIVDRLYKHKSQQSKVSKPEQMSEVSRFGE
ncbi:dicarboxylate/amino acid:cation symporter [Falsiporphyromonas endometrii]|uniref:Dicarboxylate/amino acid:cation symporter n=1 Tax=Falsiporphyromonas endometrii TaxID=1387297 RepID=A0ABV9K6A3_9PORP